MNGLEKKYKPDYDLIHTWRSWSLFCTELSSVVTFDWKDKHQRYMSHLQRIHRPKLTPFRHDAPEELDTPFGGSVPSPWEPGDDIKGGRNWPWCRNPPPGPESLFGQSWAQRLHSTERMNVRDTGSIFKNFIDQKRLPFIEPRLCLRFKALWMISEEV